MTRKQALETRKDTMSDNYIEQFITDKLLAQHELDLLRIDYFTCGMYPCANGFVVWADKHTEHE